MRCVAVLRSRCASRPRAAARPYRCSRRRRGVPVCKFASIAGIGQTEFSKASGRSELQLAAEASKAALDDAGINPADVDGLITFTIDNSDEIGLTRCLGVRDLAYTTRIPGGGAASVATI